MLKIVAWAFALLNIAPLVWMIWSSLLGASEISQGKIFPEPYSNDVAFFERLPDSSLVAATLHGQVYHFPYGKLVGNERRSMDLYAVSTSYDLAGEKLYAFSPDEGLMEIDVAELETRRTWDWNVFRRSFEHADFTEFRQVAGQIPQQEFERLGALLDTVPLVEGSEWTLSKMRGGNFPNDGSVLDSLNAILKDEALLSRVVAVWRAKSDWINPAVERLFRKRNRTKHETRELFRWCLAERIPSVLVTYRKISWTPIWVDRIPASDHGVSLATVGKYVAVGMWWESFPGIAIVDTSDLKSIRWITPQIGLPSSSVQSILRVSDKEVIVAHDQGFSLVDVDSAKVTANYLFGESGLPLYNGYELRLSVVSRSAMLFACGREIVFFDFRTGQAVKRLYGDSRLFFSDISTIRSEGGNILFGLSNGLVETGLWDLLNESPLRKSLAIDGTATSLSIEGKSALVGMHDGELARVDLETGKILEAHTLPAGGVYLHWRNYEDLWRTIPFGTLLLNSLTICCSTVLICLILGSLAAYGLARTPIRFRKFLNGGLIWSQVVPNILLLIPAFLILSYLQMHSSIQLLNTKGGIILLYSVLFLPMATWILQNFFRAVPKEIEEAALIDGCTPLTAFFRIVVPSALPGILTTGVYIFILAWDELMIAWVFSVDLSTATIPVGMRLFFGQFGSRFDLMMAAATLSTLPVLVLFLLMQRHLLSGISQDGSRWKRNR